MRGDLVSTWKPVEPEAAAPPSAGVVLPATTPVRPVWTRVGDVKGPKGDQGVPGPPGVDASYRHRQAVPAAVWVVEHGLGGFPAPVLILDIEPGVPQYTDTTYPDERTMIIEWPEPVAGWAYVR